MKCREDYVAGGETYYREWYSPAARASVVIAHGYAEHSGRYRRVAERLAAADLSVWAPDHRGHGNSGGERGDIGSFDGVVSDLDRVVDIASRRGAGLPIFLVGHSLGGAIALAYALAHQDRLTGLSLSAPAICISPEILALAQLDEIPPLPLADGVSSDPAVVEAYKSDPLVYLGPPPWNLLNALGSVRELVARFPELTLPLQVMQGSADALVPPQALKDVVAGVSSHDLSARLWPGLFHEIYNEPTDNAVVDTLKAWIVERAT